MASWGSLGCDRVEILGWTLDLGAGGHVEQPGGGYEEILGPEKVPLKAKCVPAGTCEGIASQIPLYASESGWGPLEGT